MNKRRAIYIAGIVSIIANTGLFGLKYWAGVASSSIALKADAWHTLSDSLSSVIVIIGVMLSSRKPDKEHPFGHGRWEQIAAIFIAFLLGLIAFGFLKDSVVQFHSKESASFGTLAIIVTIISILVNEGLTQYAFYVGRKTGNISLKADGWHHRTDALSSVVVLIGIIFSSRFWWIDSVLGIVVSLMLFYATYEIIKEAINKLLGEKPSNELVAKIESLIESSIEEDVFPHHYHIHNYVSNQEMTFHIKLENEMDVLTAHGIATKIEKIIKAELNIIATIHIEPKDYNHEAD